MLSKHNNFHVFRFWHFLNKKTLHFTLLLPDAEHIFLIYFLYIDKFIYK